jgi:molecular chaperone GrpE
MTDDAQDRAPDGFAENAAADAELATLREKLAAAEKARDDMKDLAQRTMADFQNFRARALKDAQSARRFAVKDALVAVLPAFDNLERALGAAESGDLAALREGVGLTLRNFEDGLGRLGVARVKTEGTVFDPACMEALARLESEDAPEGSVLAEWESGWRMADLVVRHARVSVAAAKKPAAESAGPASPTN